MFTLRTIRNLACAFAVAACVSFASGEAQAQVFHGGFHGGGYHGGGHHGGIHYGGIHNIGWGGGYGGGWGVPAHTWHDTSHYDYHPGQYVPHGNHYHYQPGHFDWHQQGHIDHNH